MLALVVGSGCADILDIPDAPALIGVDAWECEPAEADPVAPKPDRAMVRVHACNFITSNCSMPVTGLTASLCNKLDYNCNMPIQSGMQQDVNGDFMFEVPTTGSLGKGFDGYLLVKAKTELCTNTAAFGTGEACALAPMCTVSAPDEKCALPTFSTAVLFFNPPIVSDVVTPIVLPMVPSLAGDALVKAAGAQGIEDRSLGVVFVTGLDCAGNPAAGLTYTSSPIPPKFGAVYQAEGVVSATATETDESGLGGLLGIPAGFVMVKAYAGGREVASVGAQVLPYAISYVTLSPLAPSANKPGN
ncbi:MAG TPA: hypothetical protein VJR89_38220 [Polyangiales bacterium]|nr:hypothetical protein [Polyangiales bacterium]